MAQPPRKELRLRFRFSGWQDGWYILRLPAARIPSLELHAYRNEITEWLFEQDITLNELSYMANGNTGDGPVVPAAPDGSVVCLLLRNADDVLRFDLRFGCRDATPDAIYAALRAEASAHKFVFIDIAIIAHDTVRSLVTVFGEEYPEWDALEENTRELFLQLITEYLEIPSRPAEQFHATWVTRRQSEGWRYGPTVDFAAKQHPWMATFTKLADREQAKLRLIAGVITPLTSLLKTRVPA